MKKNSHEEQTGTFIWSHMTFDDPYQVIASIFDHADLAHYRELIRDLSIYSCLNKVYQKENPGNLLWKVEGINCLLQACFVLSKHKKESPVKVTEADLMEQRFYATDASSVTCWNSFPRFLSQSEFRNPYLVFKDFFKLKSIEQWQADIRELIFEAYIVCDEYSEHNIIQMYIQLSKLFEAAHLIDVREITHINGRLKYRLR